MTKYRCILIDPPWLEQGGGKVQRGAQRHYPLMTPHQIIDAIFKCKVYSVADDAHLWLWATSNHLKHALFVMDALGFRYIACAPWVKVKDGKLQKGLGQYMRGAHELLLFGTRGKTHKPEPKHRPPSVIMAPRTEHSRKPVEQYEHIEAISPGPRLELFARGPARLGWNTWGDEAK